MTFMLNKTTRLLALSLLLVAFVVAGCDLNESFVEGFDQDPNLPTDAPVTKVFIAAQVSSIIVHEGYASRLSNMWTQHVVGDEQYTNIYDNYLVTTQDFSQMWFSVYVRSLANLKVAQRKAAEANGQENLIAVAKINEAMLMGTVTALWGDVPYSEAAAEPPSEEAAFDDQTFVYEQVITRLDEAIATLEGDTRDLPEGTDVFSYDGDVEQWVRAAYTLKARFLLHQGNLPDALIAAQNGIMDDSGVDDLGIPHGTVTDENVNLWSAFTSDRGWFTGEGGRAVELLRERTNRGSDTDESGRLDFYFDTGTTELPLNNTDGAFEPDDTYPLVTFAENKLIIAEIQARQNNPGLALAALNDVRDFNEARYGGTFADLQESDFQSGGSLDETTVLREVLDEAYLSYFSQIEAFNLVRRVDDYDFGITPGGEGELPERFLYGEEELNGNPNAPDPAPGLFEPTPVNQ